VWWKRRRAVTYCIRPLQNNNIPKKTVPRMLCLQRISDGFPGGVTAAWPMEKPTLYASGQQFASPTGLFAGNLR